MRMTVTAPQQAVPQHNDNLLHRLRKACNGTDGGRLEVTCENTTIVNFDFEHGQGAHFSLTLQQVRTPLRTGRAAHVLLMHVHTCGLKPTITVAQDCPF